MTKKKKKENPDQFSLDRLISWMCSREFFEDEDEENGDEGVGVDMERRLCLSGSSALVSTGRGFGRFLGDRKKSFSCKGREKSSKICRLTNKVPQNTKKNFRVTFWLRFRTKLTASETSCSETSTS